MGEYDSNIEVMQRDTSEKGGVTRTRREMADRGRAEQARHANRAFRNWASQRNKSC